MTRTVWLMAAIAGLIVGSKLLVENVMGLDLEAAAMTWMADAGTGSAVLIVTLLAADVFLPVPSSVVMVLSGAAFGVGWGAALALFGSVAGEWLGFELVRRYGRGVSRRIAGDEELRQVNRFFDRYGAVAVIVTRPLPVVMESMSIAAGLSRMPRATFIIASFVGTIPIVILYAYAGAVSREAGSVLPATVIIVAMAAAGWLWFRSTQRPDADAATGPADAA